MNNHFGKIAVACVLAFASTQAIAATTSSNLDVVDTKDAGKVMTKDGDCVRTKWDVGMNACTGEKRVKVNHVIMQMDERIVYFDFDKSVLKDSEKAKLDILVEALKEHNVRAVKIVGYTDRLGSMGYNKGLSHRRAVAVKSYIDSKIKLDRSVLNMRALGEQDQVKGCEGIKERADLIDCLAPNRRVEVEVDYLVQAQAPAKKK